MKDRKTAQRAMKIMLLLFIILMVCAVAFGIYIYTYNHTKRQYDSGQDCAAFTVAIAPRGGQTDSWPKIVNENGKDVDYEGTIYDVTLKNTGDCNISRWNLRININQEMWLNNAWCGKFEIHQKVQGNEKVQTVDLRKYNQKDLKINYKVVDPDLLISLHAGDYLVYHPDFSTNEYPIPCGDSEKMTQVVFGAIFYDKGSSPLEFEDLHVDYYLEKIYYQNPIFWILTFSLLGWIIVFSNRFHKNITSRPDTMPEQD